MNGGAGTGQGARCVGLLALLLASEGRVFGADGGMPPVNLSGEVSTTFRYTQPQNGEATMQKIWSGEIDANSYIWQPWAALWFARLGVSSVSVEAGDQNQDSLLLTGDGRLRLFPQSRFPLEAFYDVQDTRVGVDDPLADVGDFRYSRYGLSQQYRTVDGRGYYSARVERSEQDDRAGTQDKRVDRIQAGFERIFDERQRLSGGLSVERSSAPDGDDEESTLNLAHGYRRDASFSVDSLAHLVRRTESLDSGDNVETRLLANSHASWRAPVRPLTLSGNVLLLAERSGIEGEEQRDSYSLTSSVGGSYDLTSALRATGLLGATFSDAEDRSLGTFQNLGLGYTPPPKDLFGFSYSWSASGGLRNATGGDGGGWGAASAINHSVNRVYRLLDDGVLLLGVDASQGLALDHSEEEGSLYTLTHRGGLSLGYPAAAPAANLRLTVLDARDWGRADSALQLLSTSFSSNLQLSRYSTLDGQAAFNATRVTLSGVETSTYGSSASLTYRHGRLFGYPGLRFSSELRFQSNTLLPIGFLGEEGDGLSWDNRIDYSIGRLELRLRVVMVRLDNEGNLSVFFTATRSF